VPPPIALSLFTARSSSVQAIHHTFIPRREICDRGLAIAHPNDFFTDLFQIRDA